ncbi:hypothetical protein LJC49_08080 [Ruminococcaceae bacterium OttesenSCG-928-I18]|nr:hypothetical protein [Ruminococcaceae bacterium OttesenSCG-928-I18]
MLKTKETRMAALGKGALVVAVIVMMIFASTLQVSAAAQPRTVPIHVEVKPRSSVRLCTANYSEHPGRYTYELDWGSTIPFLLSLEPQPRAKKVELVKGYDQSARGSQIVLWQHEDARKIYFYNGSDNETVILEGYITLD